MPKGERKEKSVMLPNIREMREKSGLSKYACAKLIGVTPSTYDRWELFPGKVTLGNFVKLTEVLKANKKTEPEPSETEQKATELETSIPDPIEDTTPLDEVQESAQNDTFYEEHEISPIEAPIAVDPIEDVDQPEAVPDSDGLAVLEEVAKLPSDIRFDKIDRLKQGITGRTDLDAFETIKNFCYSFDLTPDHLPALLNKLYPEGTSATIRRMI